MLIVKNSDFNNNSKTYLKKGFLQVNFQHQKTSKTIQGIQGLGMLKLFVWNYIRP